MRDLDKKDRWSYSYDELIESMEVEVLVEESDNDYQGSTFCLVREGGRVGHLVFGWGSCSGCDALQACDSHADVVDLRNSLYAEIDWFPSTALLMKWLNGDQETQWYGHDETWKTFKAKANKTLDVTDDEVNEALASITGAVLDDSVRDNLRSVEEHRAISSIRDAMRSDDGV